MAKITISISILILMVLLFRKCFYYKITRKLQYSLWLLIPLYLVLMPFIQIRLPLNGKAINGVLENWNVPYMDLNINKGQEMVFRGSKEVYKPGLNKKEQNIKDNNTENKIASNSSRVNITCLAVNTAKLLYYIISVGIILYIIIKNKVFISGCIRERKYYKTDFYTGLKIYILENTNTPFLLGKSIYINSGMLKDKQQLNYIVLHEYCHWKQGDTFWTVIKYIIISLFWYNPLLWIALYYEEFDCELACDEAVIRIAGKDSVIKYGDVLLNLALENIQKHRNIIIQNMGGKKRMLKERILYIITEKKNKKTFMAVTILIVAVVFAGLMVSFTDNTQATENILSVGNTSRQEENAMEEDIKEDKAGKEDIVIENNYYNCMKSDGVYIYFPWNNSIIRTNIKTGSSEKIAETGEVNSFYKLGGIKDGYLYYTKCKDNFAIIGRISLDSLSDEIIYTEKSGNAWGFSAPYITDKGEIYCNEGMGNINKCHVYRQNIDNTWKTGDNMFFMDKAKEIEKKLNADLHMDYINGVLQENVLFFTNQDMPGLFIYNTDGKYIGEVKDFYSNLLMADKGFIYTDKKGNIHLCSYKEPYNDNIIFKPGRKTQYINYGPYDKYGIYGYYKNKKNKLVAACLSWNGELKELYTFSSGKQLLTLSAFGNFAAFFDNGQLEIVKY